MNEKRRINPQNPMRINRWRKMKQQVPHTVDTGKTVKAPVAEVARAEDTSTVEKVRESS